MNENRLFLASCVALIATAMSFSIRVDIMGDFEKEFVIPHVTDVDSAELIAADEANLVKTNLGLIGTVAFFSFGLAIFFGGPLVDLLGMGSLLRLAAVCHFVGALLTIFAPSYWVVVAATLIYGAGNGLVEAVCNPLIATIYPSEKTHKLTLFHAWFPGGMVIGGLLAYFFTQIGLGWQLKTALLLIPTITYLILILGQKFPATERLASGVSFGEMFAASVGRPLFWIVFLMMWLTAATELVPGAWMSNIYEDIMGKGSSEGILAVVWGSVLMYILRQFFSKQAHSISPIALIALTAPLAAIGLFLFNFATSPAIFFLAATLMYVGVCFWWPTMLGIVSERCPKTGALGLAVIGGTGSIATFVGGPAVGFLNDNYGPAKSLQIWAILPVVLCTVFALVWLNDRSRGGYQIESIDKAPGEQ
jgi:MFS family permease